MRTILAALTALMLLATPAVAGDSEDAETAYNAGDYREALRIFTNNRNDRTAQLWLGHMYYLGRAVHQDYVQAQEWYLKAAKQGEGTAQYKLGLMYAKGYGVEPSDIEAYAWWSAAAENRDSDAAKAGGTLATYMSEQDLAKAKKLAKEYWINYVLE